MRLALRLAAAVTIGIGAVLAVQAVLHVNRIATLQEAEIKDDLLTLGRALSGAVEELWASGGPERAAAFIAKTDDRRERTTISLKHAGEVEDVSALPTEPRIERLSTVEGWCIVAIAPVRVDGETVAALELNRQLPNEREYFDSILWTQVATTLAAAMLTFAIVLVLGLWLIGRPIRTLSDLARRVAEGDFSLRSEITQTDEIGDLARELDAMTDRLSATQERVRAERRARTETLEKLRHADRLSTVGRLASSIAHELGTPLNIVSGRAAMIATDDALASEPRENARRIEEQARRMTGIIRQTLDFSRRKPIDREETRVGSVLEDALSLMEPILDDKGVTAEIEGQTDATLPIDPGKILQVLTNLIMNAIDAMPDGGKLTLSVEGIHVDDPTDRHASEGDFVRIGVEDEGIGIPADKLQHVFEAFVTSKTEGSGTGLGLSVCHGIVREHGGWIEVASEVGRGTRFLVYLPKKEDT